ncbi:UNVERIFIED_CONTAM: hypothetical protein FKN15_005317 [Acipenser sinensis]
MEEALWYLHFVEVGHYTKEGPFQRGKEGPPVQRRMERYESWLRDRSTPLRLRTERRHLLGDSLLDFIQLKPEIQHKGISRAYPGLMEALVAMTQVMDWVYQEREAGSHNAPSACAMGMRRTAAWRLTGTSTQKGGARG